MELLRAFFDVNTTAFTLLGYNISWLELVGTIFNLVCVLLVARRNIWNWPIGIVGVTLFGILFYQINLYADVFEQAYFFFTGIVGWYMWTRVRERSNEDDKVLITANSHRVNVQWFLGIVLVSLITGWALSRIHIWMPLAFSEPASLPFIDAGTTIMSFAAQFLMMRRKLESWILWIVVDIVAIWLYWYKDVLFVAMLFAIFLVNAVYGYVAWRRALQTTDEPTEDS